MSWTDESRAAFIDDWESCNNPNPKQLKNKKYQVMKVKAITAEMRMWMYMTTPAYQGKIAVLMMVITAYQEAYQGDIADLKGKIADLKTQRRICPFDETNAKGLYRSSHAS